MKRIIKIMMYKEGCSMKKSMMPLILAVCLILTANVSSAAGTEKSDTEKGKTAEEGGQDMIIMKVPLFSDQFASLPVAVVNDDPITLADFKESISSMHSDMKEGKTAGKKDFQALLTRLITVKLCLQEAMRIGIDELPEVQEMIDNYSRITLLELFQNNKVKDLKADEKEVDRIYRPMIREYMVKSAFFEKEADAKKVEEQIKAGGDFGELIGKALSEGTAKGDKEAQYFKGKELLPQVAKALSEMKVGTVSPLVVVGSGVTIFKLENERFPDDAKARAEARKQVLKIERFKVMEEYNKKLAKKYVKLKRNVFDAVNYEKDKIDKLLKDKRVVAEIKGDKPITVGELSEALAKKFYHGVESTRSLKKMNEKKVELMQQIIARRIFRLEAIREGVDKSEEYRNLIRDYRNSMVFGVFVERVVVPDISLSNDEIKAYYDKHVAEFSFPEMMRIQALAFGKKDDANNALEKLRKGTDFQWLSENAEGRVVKGGVELLNFGTDLLIVNDLPDDIRKAVEGARADDARLYSAKDGIYYLLYIQELVPAKPQPYTEVRDTVAGIVYNEKVGRAVEDWADKLRKGSDVKVYATGFTKN
jgi:hypothetical protein